MIPPVTIPAVVALQADGTLAAPAPRLPGLSLQAGHCVALSLPCPSMLTEAYFATQKQGLIPLVINPHLPPPARDRLVRAANARALLYADPEAPHHAELREYPAEGHPDISLASIASIRHGHVVCTSGTTGPGATPSLYVFELSTALANARAHLASLGATAGSPVRRMLLPMPLSHSFGLVAGMLAASYLDATLFAFRSTPDPSTLLRVLQREAVELVYLTPPLLRLLLRRSRSAPALPDLRVASVGSGPVTRGELRALQACFPQAEVFFTYGLTELGPRVTTFRAGTYSQPSPELSEQPERTAPLGAPLEGIALHVRNQGDDGVGELLVRTPFAARGKLDDQRLSPLACEPGGFPTADSVRRGKSPDTLEILGRSDGTIVRGGTNVYPGNLERVADAVPGVHASCAVAKPSALYGQVPVLVVELEPGASWKTTEGALRAALTDQLPPTDRPAEVHLIARFERTALGKIARDAVQRSLQQPKVPDAS